jgi:hypothetical protein
MPSTAADRIYLYVPPEDYPAAQAAGATWDELSKRWYIVDGAVVEGAVASWSRWLSEDQGPEFGLTSDEAFVASALVPCAECQRVMEVIGLFCASGFDLEAGEPLEAFTVSNISAMDEALALQLEHWPFFTRVEGAELEGDHYANHCPHCGAAHQDYRLHAEPGDAFFDIARAEPGTVELTPLEGRIQVSGDWGFGLA